MTMLLPDERAAVADTCRTLQARGLVVGTAGNVSVRVGDLVVISPSGVSYDTMRAQDVGVHRMDGSVEQATLAPSSELPLHLAVYRSTDLAAVIHTHAPASTALSTVVTTVPNTHYYSALFGGPIRVAPYARFGTDQLAANVDQAMQGRTAALLANHGAVIGGGSLPAALTQVGYLEYVCDVALRALATGRPVAELDDDEITGVVGDLRGYGQQPAR